VTGPIYGIGRRDRMEPEVIEAFKVGGASVQQLSGRDVPDLLVGFLGLTHLVEVKTDRAGLKPGQKRWADEWLGERPVVARTAPQARKWMRMWANERRAREGP
jgi:hypothetical protein